MIEHEASQQSTTTEMTKPQEPQNPRKALSVARGNDNIRFVVTLALLLGQLSLIDLAAAVDGSGPIWLSDVRAPPVSAKLEELLARVGPNMRASADYRDFQDVTLNESLEAWRLMHDQAKVYANEAALIQKPKFTHLLQESNVSKACHESAVEVIDGMRQLESWATLMWSYSGNFPPEASVDGHFHDMGSYKGCIDLVRPTRGGDGGRYFTSYCTVGFRPIVPKRPRFHAVFKKAPEELVNLYNKSDMVGLIASQAQYFHYLYWKTGVCVPSDCSSQDIQQVAKVIGRKLALMSAPVKCFTQASPLSASTSFREADLEDLENTRPVLVNLNDEMSKIQLISLALVGSFFSIVLLATVWQGAELAWRELTTQRLFLSSEDLAEENYEKQQFDMVKRQDKNNNNNSQNHQFISMKSTTDTTATINLVASDPSGATAKNKKRQLKDLTLKEKLFDYFSMIENGKEFCETSYNANEIECLHGFRVGTMLWIICVHVLQYNDWSGFTRVYENVPNLQNPFLHPIINANYVVDNFFLMSGLLVAYTTWHANKGTSANFSMFQSLLGRYLRLTPQVLLISLMYILLPLIGEGGPFWYDMTHYAAKYCEKNWWVNLLHLQAFYRTDEICNLVGWWISVDMYYYLGGLVLLWLILNKRVQLAFTLSSLFVGFCTLMTIWRHYTWGLSPNNLGLVPQIGEVWTEFVVKFFWSPYPHAYVFFLGLWLGYLMANKIGVRQVRRWSKLGWTLSLISLAAINLSSRLWLIGVLEVTTEQQVLSTSFNVICVIGWASSFAWMIVACHYGCAPLLNRLLCTKPSIMLSRASFIIYLSHMLVLRTFYGSQYNSFEVSMSILVFLVVGITFISVLFGVFLFIAFEKPCLKLQRLIMNAIKSERKLPPAGLSYAQNNGINYEATTSTDEKITLQTGATGVALFK